MCGEVVLVAVDASKEITDYALEWAVRNVIRATDTLILLAILPSNVRPPASGNRTHQSRIHHFLDSLLRKWGVRHNVEGSSDQNGYVNGVDQEGSLRINEVCVQMMRQLCSANNFTQVQTQVKVVPATQTGSVATKAAELGATWLILDRSLKRESDCCLKQLNCNIILIDHAIPKILKSITPQSVKKINISSHENDPTEAKMLGVLPTYNLDYESVTTPSSLGFNSRSPDTDVSSGRIDNFHKSPNSISRFQPAKTIIHQNSKLVESKTQAPYRPAPSYSKSQPLNMVSRFDEAPRKSSPSLLKEKTKSYSGPLKPKSDKNQHISVKVSQTPPISIRRSTNSPRLWRNLESPTGSKQLTSKRDSKNGNSEPTVYSSSPTIDRTSSIRRAMSLSIKQPPAPPPLCSVCKHNAPIFGKAPRKFSYREIERATDGFSNENFLAEGGYGPVYRGVLPDGQVVAVKQHKVVSAQGASEFCSEIEVLSCAQHRNLVMLVGYCIEKEWLLIYEFACNGSLDKHLYGAERNEIMAWNNRMKVAIGAARGLRYLHEDCRVGCIVHRDFRPTNILLTHDFEPMVGDFGLARWQADGQLAEETRVIGAFGYLAPEYTQSGLITEKADVYAFGVVLMELLTGLKATDLSRNEEQRYLPEWATNSICLGRPLLEKKICNEIIDPRLEGNYIDEEVKCLMYAASLCIAPRPEKRPRMSKVLRILEGDMPNDMTNYYGKSTSTHLEHRNNSYSTEISANQTQDYSPSHLVQSMQHIKLTPSSLCAHTGADQNRKFQAKASLDRYKIEKISSDWSLNQTEQLVSEEYQTYLQGSLVQFIQKMNVN
ncbi:hypothetical protein HHK36_027066 [Tetracentron sinense]|uniref:Protein kinase domain-containing protein n=1 Tax=Tetracentron sinense TaxID=13715 RepID=A0A835D2P6_TETSI|nr:hypothetical protein HHK36_027066 [Tetracentron sinense]